MRAGGEGADEFVVAVDDLLDVLLDSGVVLRDMVVEGEERNVVNGTARVVSCLGWRSSIIRFTSVRMSFHCRSPITS